MCCSERVSTKSDLAGTMRYGKIFVIEGWVGRGESGEDRDEEM